jgi:hypothetical protein
VTLDSGRADEAVDIEVDTRFACGGGGIGLRVNSIASPGNLGPLPLEIDGIDTDEPSVFAVLPSSMTVDPGRSELVQIESSGARSQGGSFHPRLTSNDPDS